MIFDMHVHTLNSSPCGRIDGKDMVDYYKKAGYDGIVITDHFSKFCMEYYRCSYEEYCLKHLQGYLEAKKRGEEIGLTVLYGCELRFNENGNDYLVYGMTTEFLLANPDIFTWKIAYLKQVCEENGFVFYQAHPFRNGITIVHPDNLFGMEVFNGGDNQRNDIANVWADKYNLHKIAGSDCHDARAVGTAGILFYNEISDNESLVAALQNDEYMLVERAARRKLITD